jgi:SAM-dependent methyltransferase
MLRSLDVTNSLLDQAYGEFPTIEAAFHAALDESLHPRGPDLLYEVIGALDLPKNASVIDLGCGVGRHTIELADRFGFVVHGIDPVPLNIAEAREVLSASATPGEDISAQFLLGTAEFLPVRDSSIDLIWCREVISLIPSLDSLFEECWRILRPGGRLLIYNNFVTDRAELDAAWCANLGMVRANEEARNAEAAFHRRGFIVERAMDLGGEFGEYAQETTGGPGRRLLHAARLLRSPERYITQFGRANYEIMLSDCFWHIYRLIGKLGSRVYLLQRS